MWPDRLETEQLLKQAQTCETAAVGRLLSRHREGLRQVIDLRLDRALRRRLDASDVVQGVLFEASRRIGDYLREPTLPFQIWLRQIARDQLIDAHRRHRVAERRSLDREQPMAVHGMQGRSSLDLAAELRDHQLTPAAAAVRHELGRRLHDALGTMVDDDREILLLRHFEQLSNKEAAAVLGVSEQAAGMRHLRALRRLRTILGADWSQGGLP